MLEPKPDKTIFVYHTTSLGEPNRDIVFFNQGDRLTPVFKPRSDRGPNFYWFHDSFYSHFSIAKQDRYLHLFIRNPYKDKINFSFMQDNKSWEEACMWYLNNKKPLAESYKGNGTSPLFFNPPILRTDDILVPDLIFEFPTDGANEATIIHPAEHTGISCKLFTDQHVPIPFNQIPEIVYLLPQIKEALPFIL
jgi:hypothetical protein